MAFGEKGALNGLQQSSPQEIAQRKAVLDSYDYDAGGLRTKTTDDLREEASIRKIGAANKLHNESNYDPRTEDEGAREARHARYGSPSVGYTDEQQQWFVSNPGQNFKDLQAFVANNPEEAAEQGLASNSGNGKKSSSRADTTEMAALKAENAQLRELAAGKTTSTATADIAKTNDFNDASPEARGNAAHAINKGLEKASNPDLRAMAAKAAPEKGLLEKAIDFIGGAVEKVKEMVGLGEEKHAHTAKSETAIEAPKIAQTSNEPPKSALVQQAEALRDLGKLLERPDIKESIASAVQFNDKQAIAQNGHQNHTGESLGGLNGGAGLKGQSEARSV